MNVVVVGGGRMGLPLACVLADNGADVTVCDTNSELVRALNAGECPYDEPGLDELLATVHGRGKLSASTETAVATREADVVVVIVPAHLTPDKDIDYSILQSASEDVGRGLTRGTLVCYETTVSVGGTRMQLVPVLEEISGLKSGDDFLVAFSPERVKANLVLARLRDTPKVVGGLDAPSQEKACAFYRKYLGAPVDDVGSLEAAELTKLAGMLYRDVNIALVNELAAFAEVAGIAFELVRASANGNGEANLLEPGIGVGGHCTPVYPYFFTRESKRLGVTQRLAESARIINDYQPERQVARLADQWQDLAGRNIHILGLGFRPDVKVSTFSPAFDLRRALDERKANVTLEDPLYDDAEIEASGFKPARAGTDAIDAVILNTAHSQFSDPDFVQWHASGIQAVTDGRNLWDPATVSRAGLLYLGVGRSNSRLHS